MSLYVVDASVIIKWYIPEDLSDKADAFLGRAESSSDDLIAPDFALIELSNILWKKRRRKELQEPELYTILDELFNHLGVGLVETNLLILEAMMIAIDVDCSVYDALYLAVAELYDAVLMTADERLVHSLSHHRLTNRIAFLGSA